MLKRIISNIFSGPWKVRQHFPVPVMEEIQSAIDDSESKHGAEIRFAVEGHLDIHHILRGETARSRAAAAFSTLKVWDTQDNTGILIYLLLSEKNIEIIVDRGITAKVSAEELERVCKSMEIHFRNGSYRQGALEGIAALTKILEKQFPPSGASKNELSNKPMVL